MGRVVAEIDISNFSWMFKISFAIVDLPAPVGPTIATFFTFNFLSAFIDAVLGVVTIASGFASCIFF